MASNFIGTNSTIEHFPRPALASKNHLSPNFTSGTGKGQSSLPTRRNARFPRLGSTETLFFRRLRRRNHWLSAGLELSPRKYNVLAIRAKNLHESNLVESLGCVDPKHRQPAAECQFLWAGAAEAIAAEVLSPRIVRSEKNRRERYAKAATPIIQ